jgi:HEPN domain-containing protein
MTLKELMIENILNEKYSDANEILSLIDKLDQVKKEFFNDMAKIDLDKIKKIIDIVFDKQQMLDVSKTRISDIISFIEKIKRFLKKKINDLLSVKVIDYDKVSKLVDMLDKIIRYLDKIKETEKIKYAGGEI